eukprot:6532005-Lingulodinium_polyedra.AAC.1
MQCTIHETIINVCLNNVHFDSALNVHMFKDTFVPPLRNHHCLSPTVLRCFMFGPQMGGKNGRFAKTKRAC